MRSCGQRSYLQCSALRRWRGRELHGRGFRTSPWDRPDTKRRRSGHRFRRRTDAGIDEWLLWNASSRYTEGALEPADGYPEGVEPEMRVGGMIVPLSERYAVMVVEAEKQALARAVADSIAAAAVADSLAALGGSASVADSLAADGADGVAAEPGSPEAVAGVRR